MSRPARRIRVSLERLRIQGVGQASPICSCQLATGTCEVRTVDRVW
jgi:hypothetical protein